MDKKAIDILVRLDVLKRLNSLYVKHSNKEGSIQKMDKDVVLDVFRKIGYEAKYYSQERFFSVVKKNSKLEGVLNVDLKYGVVELVISLNKSDKVIIAGPMNWLHRNYINETDFLPIRKPYFSTYEELEDILKESLELFEDIYAEVEKEFCS